MGTMASLRERAGSPFWWACVTLPGKRRRQYSTRIRATCRVADRRRAQWLADVWERDVLKADTAAKAAALVADVFEPGEIDQRRRAEAVAVEIHGLVFGRSANLTGAQALGEYSEAWLAQKRGEVTGATLNGYRAKVAQFVEHVGPEVSLELVTRPTVLAFRQSLAARVSPVTVNAALGIVANLLADAVRDGLLASNPCDGLRRLKAPPSNRRPFTVGELAQVLALATPEWKSLIHFGFYTGQRLGDLARLTWEAVDVEAGEIRFRASKTGRAMVLPLHPALVDHLAEAMPAGDAPETPVHPLAHAVVTRQGSTANLSRQFSDLLKAAGVVDDSPAKGIGGRAASPLSFHSLRHTATSLLKAAGVSAPIAQELIGHASEAMNRHYTHIDGATLREANARLPRL